MTFLLASITPVIIFLYLAYQKDHIKEPPILLAKCFFGGFLAVVLAFFIDIPLVMVLTSGSIRSPLLQSLYDAFVVAAAPEELAKFTILYWIIWRNKAFDHYYDGILYAVFISLGFALVENILYVFDGGLRVALIRGVFAVPGHGFFAVLMGYYFSLARFHEGRERRQILLKSLALPILFHGLYDAALFYSAAEGTHPLIITVVLVFFTLLVIRLWQLGFRKISLHHQKDRETIAQSVVELP